MVKIFILIKNDMKKILAFIKNKEGKLLLLKGSENDPQFHESFWYTVTGAKEDEDADIIGTVRREVKEETNLDIDNIYYLNWILEYQSGDTDCEEYVFICDDNGKNKIILNEENIDFKWLDIDEFLDIMKWYGSKEILKNVLILAFNKNRYFKEEKRTRM